MIFHAFCVIVLLCGHHYAFGYKTENCEPLKPQQNVQLSCRNETTQVGTVSTICSYKCKEYYTPFGNNEHSSKDEANNYVRCDSEGNWRDLHKFESFSCIEECGRRLTNPRPLILHGTPANSSEWPWHATIFRKSDKSDKSWVYICGASLIRRSVILTAAHCVTQLRGDKINTNSFKVILGGTSVDYATSSASPTAQIFDVKKVYISENYNPNKEFQADLALVHLSGDAHFSEYVLPVCLPNEYSLDVNAIQTGRFGEVVGFGVDETGDISKGLRHASLMVASQTECFHSLKRILSESQFCAGSRRDLDGSWVTVCNGDSGGGYVFQSSVLHKYFIHGIVSTGDNAKVFNLCQNYAVFTRVFQFIFWVRDILERINGETIRELESSSRYPYVQHGSEISSGTFSPIPHQWDNLITSIEISYYNINPEIFFKSLEKNQRIEHLNLTLVRFTKPLKGLRAILPNLKTFILDLPELECWIGSGSGGGQNAGECEEKDPTTLSKHFIKSLIFFDNYESKWELENISHLKTNVHLTIQTSKLLSIDHDKGTIILQIPECSKILQHLVRGFELRSLAISKCELYISHVLTRRDEVLGKLKKIVLENISYRKGDLTDLLDNAPELEDLRVISQDTFSDPELEQQETQVYLGHIPKSLKYLALTNARLEMFKKVSSKIHFGETSQHQTDSNSNLKFPNIEIFYCSFCSIDESIMTRLALTFPNIKKLIFRGEQNLDISKLVSEMQKLEEIIFQDINESLGEGLESEEGTIGFMGLEKFRWGDDSLSLTEFRLLRKNGNWLKFPLQKSIQESVAFTHSGIANFWTSFEEYESDTRLTSFEKKAYTTGVFLFKPNVESGLDFPRLKRIPSAVRTNLKSVEIGNIEVIPSDLLESLTSAFKLESVNLDNVKLIGYFFNSVELPNLREFRLNVMSNPEILEFGEFWTRYGLNFFIPLSPFSLQNFEVERGVQGERYDYLPYKDRELRMEKFEISFDDCRLLYINSKNGFLISTPHVTSPLMPNLHKTTLKRISLRLNENEYFNLTLPTQLERLNLHCKSHTRYDLSNKLLELVSPLNRLTHLRISVHHFIESQYYFSTRTILKLSDLEASRTKLQLMSIVEAHIGYYATSFPQVKTLLFESCTFDEQLTTKFFRTFPALTTLAVLCQKLEKLDTEQAFKWQAVQEGILLNALKNDNTNIKQILGYLGPSQNLVDQNRETEHTNEIFDILRRAGVGESGLNKFILEKINGKWKTVTSNSTENDFLFENKIAVLRGDTAFGQNSCSNRATDL